MKTISSALKSHLAQPLTTLAKCILITRTDGYTVALTEHDLPVGPISGVTYLPSPSVSASATTVDLTFSVNNAEVWGLFDNSVLEAADLESGKYDYAAFNIFAVNWLDLTQGIIKLGAGTFGEVTITPQRTFLVELRGLTQAFVTEFGNVFAPICRADLGDAQCKFPLAPAKWQPDTAVTAQTLAEGDPTYVSDPAPSDDAHFLAVYWCIAAGTTDPTPPSFNPTIGALTVESSGVVWQSIAPARGVGTVAIVQTPGGQFSSAAPLVYQDYAATMTAVVTFLPVTTFSVILFVNDGVHATATITVPNGLSASAAASNLAGQINGAGLDLTATSSGDACTVTKTVANDGGYIQNAVPSGYSAYGILSFADQFFRNGYVTWKTGNNAGLSMEIGNYVQGNYGGDNVDLFMNMPFPIQVGDVFYYYAGCDKRLVTCFQKFNNTFNRRAEDFLPGIDFLFNYPEAQ